MVEVGKYNPMTECLICGRHINAGIDPPVCRDKYSNCLDEWKLMAAYGKMTREEIKKNEN